MGELSYWHVRLFGSHDILYIGMNVCLYGLEPLYGCKDRHSCHIPFSYQAWTLAAGKLWLDMNILKNYPLMIYLWSITDT